MTTAQLLVLLLVIVVAVVLVWLLVRRSAARKDDARAEAAGLRADAAAVASTLPGQEAFAAQAEERAEVARTEAERLAAEASGYRETVEVVREDHRSMLARADEIDPDVDASDPGEGERRPMTRAEARQMREEAERAAWAGSPAAPVPGAAGAAVMGRDTGGVVRGPAVAEPEEPFAETSEVSQPQDAAVETGEPVDEQPVAEEVVVEEPGADESTPVEDPAQALESDEDSEERSARIAAATDYRDGDAAEDEPYVWGAARAGTEGDMDEPQADETSPADESSHTAATEAQTPAGEWGGPHTDESEDAPVAEDAADTGGAEDADEVADADEVPDTVEAVDTDEAPAEAEPEADAYDPTPERDWAADEGELLAENSEKADELAAEREQMDRDAAAVGMEPVHPEVVEQAERDEQADRAEQDTSDEQADAGEQAISDEAAPAAEAPVAEDADSEDESALDGGTAPVEQPVADGEDAAPLVEEPEDSPEDSAADGSEDEPESVAVDATEPAAEETARPPRRISEFDEIRDGGYGMGSAAAIEDGAQPMDHPVQAYRDTMTYRVPGDPGYDEATADVWFYDQGAAERSGFRRSEG